ncbi:DNA polymerase III subunit beta [Patescibacteria group bacterium]|nr:DNA polymerase III subunit beta [Patescibacteria group bacterium]
MKITCTQENLSYGLQVVSHVASKNVSLPILSNVLLKAEKGGLVLITTNLEIGLVCKVRGKVEQEGAITVQAKTLSDYVSLLPKENIELEIKDQALSVRSSKSKTNMKGMEATEFPLIPEVESKSKHFIKAKDLKEALTAVVFAVAFDETRPEISGVYFNFDKDILTLVSTDSYRLAEKKASLTKPSEKKSSVIVPIRTTQELIRILGEENDEVVVSGNENQIVFSLGDIKLTSRVIEGQYPDYQQIIPTEHKTRILVNTNEFINTIKRASLFCKPGSNDIELKFNQAAGEIEVTAANLQVGESEARQEAKIEGVDNDIVLNYRFLLDGLQNINDENCSLDINTNSNPGLLKPIKGEDYRYIIMPIKQ